MRALTTGLVSALVVFSACSTAFADRDFGYSGGGRGRDHGQPAKSFNRIATFANYRNRADAGDETVSEIVAASKDGKLLAYSDAASGAVGFVGIHQPSAPVPLGSLSVGGDPTSVDILGNDYALVGVNTGTLANPTGELAVVDLHSNPWTIVAVLPLGGQPDSIKISDDGKYVAVVIENERDEDVVVNGVEGGLPQAPAGLLNIVDVAGAPAAWTVRAVDLTGLSDYAPEDPEPEFVDINAENIAVVSFQENNWVALVDLESGSVIGDFPAGSVDLDEIDTVEEDVISLTGSLAGVPREPDAIAWVPTGKGEYLIATANEGDLFGGSRGFSLFEEDGTLVYDSGNSYDHLAVRHGHYPESRSENKGSEPESAEFGRFGDTSYLFIGSERGSFIAVYEIGKDGMPEYRQLLPAPLGPEGVLAIPSRNLLIASGEEDDPTFGVRSTMMIYELQRGEPDYPQILSADSAAGTPIPWSALSGMVAKPGRSQDLLAVWDSYYAESRIFTIDPTKTPAVITDAITIQGGTGNYDPEGIAVAPDGSYWIASEGNAGSRPNRLLHTDSNGVLIDEIGLPAEIEACRAASANTATLGSGFEGVAVLRQWHSYKLLVAQQRGWDYTTPECEDLDDDAGGLDAHGQPNRTRIWIYDPKSGQWDHIAWELAPLPANASWVGLSEITEGPLGSYVVIERDNRTGDWAELKTLVKIDRWAAFDGLIDASEKRVVDIIPAMEATNGWISDKPEGVAIGQGGQMYVVTDNDGVDDWSGETAFLRIGNFFKLFYSRWF
jgi:hypothetical protein